jgi:hypothetical protein
MLIILPIRQAAAANENNANQADASRQIVRVFSPCGPCLTEGELIKTTDKFYVFREWRGGARYEGEKRMSKAKAHIEPCPSCTDHARTLYAHGYMD